MLSDSLQRARTRAGVSAHFLALASDVPVNAILAWEAGRSEPTPQQADSIARVFGVRIKDLDKPGGWPLERLLFRSHQTQALETLANTGAWRTIGEFLRAVADLVELVSTPCTLPTMHRPSLDSLSPVAGEALAREFRRTCGLGESEPIPSMNELLKALGVHVFYTTPSDFDSAIDGVSTRVPAPAILVNLVEGPQSWRTRMTLAHELCHLLVDHTDDARSDEALVSPSNQSPAYSFYDGHAAVEQRANAFAACLLAPTQGVRDRLADRDPTSEDSVVSIASHFGLGRTTAINRIRDVFDLSATERERMRSRSPGKWDSDPVADVAEGTSVRGGVLRDATLDALARGAIDPLRAREILGVSLSEALPLVPGVDPSLLLPLREPGDRARRVAQQYVVDVLNRADLIALPARRDDDGWTVPLAGNAGSISVSFDMQASLITPLEL